LCTLAAFRSVTSAAASSGALGPSLKTNRRWSNGTLIALAPAMANTGTCRSFAVVAIACTQSSHGRGDDRL